jgi:hypothetical protein
MAGIIVNLNLDMIGRSDADASKTRKHYVIGSAQITPDLKTIIAGVNAKTVKWPLDFESQESSMSGSDHYNFHRQGIPTAFFFSGRHEDLHAPTDDPEKVDFEKVQRLSQLIYEVTAELSNRDKSIKPAVAPKGDAGSNRSATPRVDRRATPPWPYHPLRGGGWDLAAFFVRAWENTRWTGAGTRASPALTHIST